MSFHKSKIIFLKKYTGVDGTCQNKGTTYGAVMTNWIIGEGQAIGTYGTPAGNEAWLEYAVTNMGPVSVCLYVSNQFFSYTTGNLSIFKFIMKKHVLKFVFS